MLHRKLLFLLLLFYCFFFIVGRVAFADDGGGDGEQGTNDVASQIKPKKKVNAGADDNGDISPSTGGGKNKKKSGEDAAFSNVTYAIFSSAFPVFNGGNLGKSVFVRGLNFPPKSYIEFSPDIKDKRVTVESLTDSEGKTMFKLSLKKGKTWLKEEAEMPFSELFVQSLHAENGKVLYKPEEEVPIARIFPTPVVMENPDYKLPQDRADFTISGKFFNRKATTFKFDPPLIADDDYEISINAEGTKAHLTLLGGKKWRKEPGLLKVVAVSSVPGEIKDVEVTVAKVTQALGKENPASVENTAGKGPIQIIIPDKPATIYRTSKGTAQLKVQGTGFSAVRPPVFTFKNGPAQGDDFDVAVVSPTELYLTLKKGAAWLAPSQVPGELVLSSVNGEVPSIVDGDGNERNVLANVVEVPVVFWNRKTVALATATRSITVSGRGFSSKGMTIGLVPESLKQGEDFEVEVRDSETIMLTLVEGKSWLHVATHSPGASSANKDVLAQSKANTALYVSWIAVRNAEKVMQTGHVFVGKRGEQYTVNNNAGTSPGVRIAMIEKDFSGVISVLASHQKVYQSQTRTFSVFLTSLPPKFEFPKSGENEEEDPKVDVLVEFAQDKGVVDASQVTAIITSADNYAAELTVTLKETAKQWASREDTSIFLTAIKLPGITKGTFTRFPLGRSESEGVQVAQVIRDVTIQYHDPPPMAFQTFSTLISIKGTGFSYSMHAPLTEEEEEEMSFVEGGGDSPSKSATTEDEEAEVDDLITKVVAVFDPPLIQDEDYILWVDSTEDITLELLPGKKWRKDVPGVLTLVALNAGAGLVNLNLPIAKIVPDSSDQLCMNDCVHVNDGNCDDNVIIPGSDSEYYCQWGHDCADCGPRTEANRPLPSNQKSATPMCNDDCGTQFTNDGICDDGRPGEWQKHCDLGTDCTDCGSLPEGGYDGLPFCSNGVDGSSSKEMVPGLKCVWPVTIDGVVYNGVKECIMSAKPPNGDAGVLHSGWGWCPVSSDFEKDKKWASCQYCADVLDDPSLFEHGNEEEEEEDGFRGKAKHKVSGSGADDGGFLGRLFRGVFFLVICGAVVWAVSKYNRWSKLDRPNVNRYEMVNKGL